MHELQLGLEYVAPLNLESLFHVQKWFVEPSRKAFHPFFSFCVKDMQTTQILQPNLMNSLEEHQPLIPPSATSRLAGLGSAPLSPPPLTARTKKSSCCTETISPTTTRLCT
ncbi:Uncharacterized protein Fot_10812 [Forsythia ovata]|uniref:Uncharacterized protein n=1 Tax=Forsythia ovata TaxID=205694 RepID=A0ABD1WHW3_9LAMI